MISWLLLFSRSSISCEFCLRSLRTVIATLPPSPWPLGLWYHGAYPSCAGGVPFVSVIATMWLFWLSAAACRLMILPLVPFIFAYSILIRLWFPFFFFPFFLVLFFLLLFIFLLVFLWVLYFVVTGLLVGSQRFLSIGLQFLASPRFCLLVLGTGILSLGLGLGLQWAQPHLVPFLQYPLA